MTRLLLVLLSVTFSLNSFAQGGFGDLENAQLRELPKHLENAEMVPMHPLEVFGEMQDTQKGGEFPSSFVRAYDPINKKWYEKSLVGKAYRAGLLQPFHYWRYVTVYNVTTAAERISYLPYFEEDCHDSSAFMAQWGESRSLKVTLKSEVTASVGYEGIGLSSTVGMSIEQGVTFSTARRVKATDGLVARHYPYKQADTWTGKTYIQYYNKRTGEVGYLGQSIADRWFGGYPYDFELNNQNIGFKVKRDIMKECPGYNPDKDETTDMPLYLKEGML
jgi:hypothetical protein